MNEPQRAVPQRKTGSELLGGCALLFVAPFVLAAFFWGMGLLGQTFNAARQVLGV